MDDVPFTGSIRNLPGALARRAVTLQVMRQLRQDGARIAKQFGLPTPRLQAERAGVNGHYGICYRDGRIRIRLRHARTGRLLKYSSLVNTLCHELAHLRHFNHGERFKKYYFRLLHWARQQRIYVPATATARGVHRADPPDSGASREQIAEPAVRTERRPDTGAPPVAHPAPVVGRVLPRNPPAARHGRQLALFTTDLAE